MHTKYINTIGDANVLQITIVSHV